MKGARTRTAIPPKIQRIFDHGVRRSDSGDFKGAVASFSRFVSLRPDVYQGHFNLGRALTKLGRNEEALVSLRRVLEIQPNHLKAVSYLANVHKLLGNLTESVSYYRKALQLNPHDAGLMTDFASALTYSGREQEAMATYQRALTLAPDLPPLHLNLGNLVRKLSGDAAALPHYERAVKLDPDYANAWANLGIIHQQSRPGYAVRCFREALSREPDHFIALPGLLTIEQRYCEFDSKDETHAKLVKVLENKAYTKLTWQIAANLVYKSLFAPLPLQTVHNLQKHIALNIEREKRAQGVLSGPSAATQAKDGRLRIGYLSPNFGSHPVGQVTLSLFPAHNRERFEVHAFSTRPGGSDESEFAAKHRMSFDGFHEIGAKKPHEAAAYIRSVGIDILVDLDGYMDNTSPPILALRPAPIQVFWLGHAGGLGLPFVDYLIADAIVVPPGEESDYREAVVRLPDIYHCADRHTVASNCPPRQTWGLPDNGMVYCVFNNPDKIDRRVFECWMRILNEVDGSVLWLSAFRQNGELLLSNLQRYAERQGVHPKRLILSERVPEKSMHFARIAHADLMLDTLTLNASTTALDSLWSGVPLLAVRGDRFSNRISNSMLHAIGLDDLVCADLEEYERRAIQLGKDPGARSEIRQRLEDNRETTPLFNIERFVRNLESGFEAMWDRHCRGEPPISFDVTHPQPSPTSDTRAPGNPKLVECR